MSPFKQAACLCGLLLAALWMSPAYAAGPEEPIVWKVSTIIPRGMGWANQVEKILIPALTEYSQGRFRVKAYWGGIQGDDAEVLKKIRQNTLQAAGFDAWGTVVACREMAVLELPFMFRGWEEVDYVREKMFPVFARILEDNGLVLGFWMDQDFDQIYSVKHPLSDRSRFAGSLFVNWSGPLERRVLETLGARSETLPVSAVNAAFKAGRIDSAIGPALWIVGTQMYSEVRYINPTNIRYSPGAVVVSEKAWRALPEDYRKGIRERRAELTRRFVEATREDNQRCLAAMVQYGLKIVEMDPEAKALMQAETHPVWAEMAGALYPKSLLEELLGHLKDFREGRVRGKAAQPRSPRSARRDAE